MKKLFTDNNRGYSWSNDHTYYLCESEEEYDQLVDKYKNHENYIKVWDKVIRNYYHYDANLQVFPNQKITCTPHTECSDGFCIRGGRKFEATGITLKHVSKTSTMDYSSYDHYIKPGSIVTDEVVKTESWWA